MGRLLQYRFPGAGPDAGRPPEPTSPALPPVADAEAARRAASAGTPSATCSWRRWSQLEDGDFEEGVREMNRVLAVRGQRRARRPAPCSPCTPASRDGTEVEGQSRIARCSGVDRVWITPGDVRAHRRRRCGRSRTPSSS